MWNNFITMKFWHKNDWNQLRDCGWAAFERKGLMLYPIYISNNAQRQKLEKKSLVLQLYWGSELNNSTTYRYVFIVLWMRWDMPASEQLTVASVTRWPWALSEPVKPVAVGAKLQPTTRTVMTDNDNAGACTLFAHIHEQVHNLWEVFEFTTINMFP